MSYELQMQINDVFSCLGQCSGCALMVNERKAKQPDMSEAVLNLTTIKLIEYAKANQNLKFVNVIFGIGDHILFGSDYLSKIHMLGSKIIEAANPKDKDNSVVFFSTSLVGREENVIKAMEETKAKMSGEVPFIPQVVLDGRLMQAAKFGPKWQNMVSRAKTLFGRVDLATNLSADAISVMSPSQLIDFAKLNEFDEIAVNWVPTMDNHLQTLSHQNEIARWLTEFDDLLDQNPWINTTYRPVIVKMLNDDKHMNRTAIDTINQFTEQTILKSFEIEPSGHIISKFEAVGDVTHSSRHGLQPLGHINDGTILETLLKAVQPIKAKIASIHSKGACLTCSNAPVCSATGFHVATHVARQNNKGAKETSCPHIGNELIEYVKNKHSNKTIQFSI